MAPEFGRVNEELKNLTPQHGVIFEKIDKVVGTSEHPGLMKSG
jgi:hypothetical protein